MFSKNIKVLSLFLVLAVVMIGAVSAVSAEPATDGPIDNATVTNTGDTPVSNGNIITINDTVKTGAASTGSLNTHVPESTVINATTTGDDNTLNTATQPNVVVSSGIYTKSSDVYTLVDGATVDGATVTLGTDGTFATDLTINGADKLTDGTTYYLNVVVPKGSAAYTDTVYTYLSADSNSYIAFTYNDDVLALDDYKNTISYGDSWSFSGTLTKTDGTPVDGVNVDVTVGGNTYTVATDKNGKFSLNDVTYKALTGSSTPLAVTTTNMTFEFSYSDVSATATLNITPKNGKVNGVLNDSNADFGAVDVSINGTVLDINGDLIKDSTVTVTGAAINQATGEKTDLTFTRNTDGSYTLTTDSAKAINGLDSGVYFITLSATGSNYKINNSDVMVLTINKVATNLTANKTIYTTNDVLKATTIADFIKAISNSTTGNEKIDGTWTAVLYKADGTAVKAITPVKGSDANLGTATINNILIGEQANGNYYVLITFTPTDKDNYAASNTTVNIVIKNSNVITVTPPSLKYNLTTTGNGTYANITFETPINTTVEMFINNKSLGNVNVINGKATIDFGALALSAGDYNVTYAFAGDDTYLPYNVTATVSVTGQPIGDLNAKPTVINGVTLNTVNKTFTLNLTNSTNDLVNYTGDVNYYIGGKLAGTVSMVEGKVTVDANTLKGLTKGAITVTFKINNNYTSKPVYVIINTVQLTSDIIAKNISTNNVTPITIKGTVANATEGTVQVFLFDSSKYDPEHVEDNVIASTTTKVNADGSFTATFGNYANGNYTVLISYTSTTQLTEDVATTINVTVNGTAPEPTPVVGNITTNLTINTNFTEAYGEGLNLTGKLTDANGNPIVGQHIALNLTNPANGASKIYWVTTDTNGEYQLQINLFVGSYTASASFAGFTTADNKTYYLPSGPANGTITVTNGTEPVDNRTATVLSFSNFTEKYGQALNFTGTLKTTDGTPIIGQKIGMILSNAAGQSKLYWRTTDSAGEVQLPIELFAGDYTFKCYFEGDSTYQPSNNQTGSITVTA
ncbi:beta strand repeat-containing protein [Methanobrevibacter sp. UBA417]|jgi:protocatechuate 3,4-dioxygenase beta subunit|uniref:beta strand repeat-containing protein n=1 Tax=Methanobrevibacter sp. UBA417 TaxID=1915487 RepID=UPI0039B85504